MNDTQYEALVTQGQELYMEGSFDQAYSTLNEAVHAGTQQGRNDMTHAAALNMLSGLLRMRGDEPQALDHCQRAFQIMESECEPGDPDMAGVASNIGQMLQNQGDIAAAQQWYEKAIQIHTASDESDRNPALLAQAYAQLASTCQALGHTDRQVEYLWQAVTTARSAKVRELDIKFALQWSEAVMDTGNIQEAATELQTLFDEYQRELGAEPDPTAFIDPEGALFEMIKEDFRTQNLEPMCTLLLRIQLATALRRLGKEENLIETLPAMSTFQGRVYGEESVELGEQYQAVGVALHFLGQEFTRATDLQKAENFYRQSLEILEKRLPPEDERLDDARANMEELQEDLQQF